MTDGARAALKPTLGLLDATAIGVGTIMEIKGAPVTLHGKPPVIAAEVTKKASSCGRRPARRQ